MEIKLTNSPFLKRLLIMVMKTFIFLLCTTVFSLTPKHLISQNAKIVIEEDKTATVDEVFDIIRAQTNEYMFIYHTDLFKDFPNVELKQGTIRLNKLLEQCLSSRDLNIVLTENNTILIKDVKTIQQQQISGKVTDEAGLPVPGATVLIKGTTTGTATNINGDYSIRAPNPENVLVFSSLGFQTQEVKVGIRTTINVILSESSLELDEVLVVSDGYQEIPRERATGAISTIDKKLIDQRIETNIISKLEGLSPGLIFNTNSFTDEPKLSIRGRSTIFSEDQPLIVVNGYPIEGDINDINPNDVESINVLKDAAAASIWGARSSNGVIVITTKMGKYNQDLKVEYRSNITIQEKPDLSYLQYMSTADFIEAQEILYDAGEYWYLDFIDFFPEIVVPDALQTFVDRDNGLISPEQAQNQLNTLGQYDNIDEYSEYFLRNEFRNQHSLSFSGGSEKSRYFASLGYDKGLNNLIQDENERITLNLNNTFKISNKLSADIAANLSHTKDINNGYSSGTQSFDFVTVANPGGGSNSSPMPYDRIFDDNGNALNIARIGPAAAEDLESQGYLSFDYKPGEEWKYNDNVSKQWSTRIQLGLNYDFTDALKAQVKYSLERNTGENRNRVDQRKFEVRSLINRFTTIDDTTGELTRNIPLGDILYTNNFSLNSYTLRGQLNYNKKINNGEHQIDAILGTEIRETKSESSFQTRLGYNDNTLSYATVNLIGVPNRNGGTSNLNFPSDLFFTKHRFISHFANASYTFKEKYTISGSGRTDESDLFGVKRNQRLNPFWSVGLGWKMDKENFIAADWINNLKLRATYGVNGNINRGATAFITAQFFNNSNTLINTIPFADITNPQNDNLTWEESYQLDLGLDFTLFNNRISGSFDYYKKDISNLFADINVAQSSGFDSFKTNAAEMKASGFEVALNTKNIDKSNFKWNTTVFFTYATDKITKIDFEPEIFDIFSIDRDFPELYTPFEDSPLFGVYAYKWDGLDDQGNARIFLPDGTPSDDPFESIRAYTEKEHFEYMGRVNAPYFGRIGNTLQYKNLSLTANISYKFGHVYRKPELFFSGVLDGNRGHESFSERWQEPGDENTTDIPSFTTDTFQNFFNEWFYERSDINVSDASHIRLADILLNYTLDENQLSKIPISRIDLYFQASNLGLLWKANNDGIDPDYVPRNFATRVPPGKTISFGVKIGF